MYFILLIFFLTVLFFSPTLSVYSYDPFGAPDDPHPLEIDKRRMFCMGRLPKGSYGDHIKFWDIKAKLRKHAEGKASTCRPYSWSASNFTTLADLCTAHGNLEGNLGGMCHPVQGPLWNPLLAYTVLLYDERVENYCRQRCFCPNNEDTWLDQELNEVKRRKGIADLQLPDYMDNSRPPEMGGPMILSKMKGVKAMGSQNPKQGSMIVRKPVQPQTYYGPTWICHTPPGSKELACACRRNLGAGSSRIRHGQPPVMKGPSPVWLGKLQGMPLKGSLGM